MPSVSGTTFDDNNRNGVMDAGDVGQPRPVVCDIVVNGTVVQTLTTTSGNDGTFSITMPTITARVRRAAYPPGYVCSTDGGKGYQEVPLVTANVSGVHIGSMTAKPPVPSPKPPVPVPSPPSKLAGLGAVAYPSQVSGQLATIQKLKLNAIRAFGPSWATGTISTADFDTMAPFMVAGIKYIAMIGCAENSKSIPSIDAIQKNLATLAPMFAKYPNAIFEHNNEWNLPQYWPGGTNTPTASSTASLMAIIKATKAALPKGTTIIGPSVGWGASPQPHLDCLKALLDSDLLSYVTAINTHFYFTNPAQVEDVLAQYRAWCPTTPIYVTECNFNVTLAKYAATAAGILTVLKKYNVFPCVYRYCPTGTNEMNGLGLTDGKGNINATVAGAWAP